MREALRKTGTLALSILVCESAGLVGSIPTFNAIPGWYAQLRKPSFTPPGAIFGPVWTTLYAMMGIAAWIIWNKRRENKGSTDALSVFSLQLMLNAGWSLIFFGLRSPRLAFFEIIALIAAIVATVVLFWRISKPAAVLLVPYLAWSAFAAILNFSIWRLNA